MEKLTKLSKKTNLPVEMIKDIIVQHHTLNNYYPKKELSTIPLAFSGKKDISNYNKMLKLAQTLKVDVDAVICVALLNYIKAQQG